MKTSKGSDNIFPNEKKRSANVFRKCTILYYVNQKKIKYKTNTFFCNFWLQPNNKFYLFSFCGSEKVIFTHCLMQIIFKFKK